MAEKTEDKKVTEKYKELSQSRDNWMDCAFYYAEKFQMAYKGFLMTNGMPEDLAQQESLKVLDKIQSCS